MCDKARPKRWLFMNPVYDPWPFQTQNFLNVILWQYFLSPFVTFSTHNILNTPKHKEIKISKQIFMTELKRNS